MDKLNAITTETNIKGTDNPSELDVFLKKDTKFNLKNYDTNFLSEIKYECGDGYYELSSKFGDLIKAKISKSCTFKPKEGDLVEVSGIYNGCFYILSLVDSEFGLDGYIEYENLEVNVNKFNLISNSIKTSANNISFESLNFDINSVNSNQLFAHFTMNSQNSTFQSSNNNERYLSSNREILGTENLVAINYSIKSNMSTKISGKTTFVYGEDLLRTDAKLIVTG